MGNSTTLGSLGHDAWTQKALGKACGRVYRELQLEEAITVEKLAQSLSARPAWVKGRLKRLQDYNLARSTSDDWYRTERDLAEVAQVFGTVGRRQKLEERYQAEREVWSERKDEPRTNPHGQLSLVVKATGEPYELPKPQLRLEAALSYARQGIPVLPLHDSIAGRCTCIQDQLMRGVLKPYCGKKDVGKHPVGDMLQHGSLEATTDEDTIRKWWKRYPYANVGIATGQMPNGRFLYVVDVDPRNDGDLTWLAILCEHHGGRTPDTAIALSGDAPGRHLYFLSDSPIEMHSTLGPGIDLIGQGRQVVAPGSIHQNGRRYEWLQPLEKLAPMPAWLRQLVEKTPSAEEWTTLDQASIAAT